MRIPIFIACLAPGSMVQAQSWCPPDAEWTFDYATDVGQQTGVMRLEYDGDTLLNGSSAERLRQWVHMHETGWVGYITWSQGNLFTRSTDDVVELYDPVTQTFDTIMWFAAQPGQHWTRALYGGPDEQTIIVQGTSTIVMDGFPLRQLVVSGDPAFWFGTDTLIERIGYHRLYPRFEESLSLDGGARDLYCYRDGALSYSRAPASECGFTVGIKTTPPGDTPTLFPDPGTDHFTLSLSSGPHTITLFDATGRVVLQERSSDERATISTAHLPSGIYVVRVDEEVVPLRWVKQ